MKILYICNEVSRKNGWCVINYYTIQNSLMEGHEVDVVVAEGSENHNFSNENLFPILSKPGELSRSVKSFVIQLLKLRRIIKEGNYDVVHILVEPYLVYFAFLKHPNIILTLVGTYCINIFRDSRFKSLYHRALKRVRNMVSISSYTAREFNRTTCQNRRIDIVPLGVDMSVFDAEFEVGCKELSFCLVGHLKQRKGAIWAIKAIEKIRESYPEVKLYLIGDSTSMYAQTCINYIEENSLSESVIVKGILPQSEIKEIYKKCIANVLPSVNADDGAFEGFGLIHLEANACSIPSIGSLECGNESAIIDGVNGYLVGQEDWEELAIKMLDIIVKFKNSKYESFARSSYEYARKNTWNNYYKSLEVKY